VPDLIKDKEILSSGMRQEVDRCAKAVEVARQGRTVAVICSGDPGIYAMAGLVFEIVSKTEDDGNLPAVEVVPGIPALSSCAARLGAPLMHDFASISLSDLLTPWDLIVKRLEAAASADFVIAIYNPKSKGRPENINRAQEIILKHRPGSTPVGIVKAATRENEKVTVTDLAHMLECEIDMLSTVIIGNSQTFQWNGRMITPRGYGNKYKI
jgi:precorrin-3B C17-methyltransferase